MLSGVRTHIICLLMYGNPVGNRPIGNIWHKKLILHLNLPIGFPQLRDLFPTYKFIILVNPYIFDVWVTYGEKEINEIMLAHVIPRSIFPTDVPYVENLWNSDRWL